MSILSRFARGESRVSPATAAGEASNACATDRECARGLACAIDRAIELGLWEHANRVAGSAARLAGEHAMLTERLARLRLAQGDVEAALALIESCRAASSSLRLLRCVCLIQMGRRHEAHLDLRTWINDPTAPLQARRLLSLLEWHEGDSDEARRPLMLNLAQIEDPQSLLALLLISVAEENADQAAHWGARLQRTRWHRTAFSRRQPLEEPTDLLEWQIAPVLASLGLATRHAGEDAGLEQVRVLALELLAEESLIPALVEAQRIEPDDAASRLLAMAIESVIDELEDAAAGHAALVQLMQLTGDSDAACRWMQQGLAKCPMSVALARLAQELGTPNEIRLEVAA